jgi:hypothetical protein
MKVRRGRKPLKGIQKPAWVDDPAKQAEWERCFTNALKTYQALDGVVSAILGNKFLLSRSAVSVRSYVDKGVTDFLNRVRKERGAKHKKDLEVAIAGLNKAIALLSVRGDTLAVQSISSIAIDFSRELGRCREAFATKRHGRDQAHSILSEFHSFLENNLGRSVTYSSLANLVIAGYEAEGICNEVISEEQIRKNLTKFRKNNPYWRDEINPRFLPALLGLERK